MKLQDIAKRMREIAKERDIPELVTLADQIPRRSFYGRSPNRSARMTPELAAEIRAYAAVHYPAENMRSIGRRFNVDGGRVSEAIHGYRE